ncbi:MAG: bifunctional phosphopantothenoylcysteine decarboxylase/phosphopantothenate--cysteine ligase CoaBC [Pseudomonadota bacterium]
MKRVLLIIGGGVAAYKALEAAREMMRRGIAVSGLLTKGGAQFITPLSVTALTGEKCYTDLFDMGDEAEMGHIELSRSADLLLVAPATADLMAKAANGHADDLASTALLATDKPVMMAPAMNVRMWEHAATQRNIATLKEDSVRIIGPDEGPMACGEFGPGRMAEPAAIADAVDAFFTTGGAQPLKGRRVLVNAGPTHEPIDPVRYIANRSSGKQGFAIADALAKAGADVTLVTGPVSIPTPATVDVVRVQTAREMLTACEAALPVDCAVCTAAVADFRPDLDAHSKIKKERGGLTSVPLAENPDILATLSAPGPNRPRIVVGFAAETNDVVFYAQNKLAKKGCDLIVANDVSGDVMGGDRNHVHLVTEDDVDDWPDMPKTEVGARLAVRIGEMLDRKDAE